MPKKPKEGTDVANMEMKMIETKVALSAENLVTGNEETIPNARI